MRDTSLGSRLSSRRSEGISEISVPDGTPPERRRELDFAPAILIAPAFGWSKGTKGIIVDAFATKAMIEIADRKGRTLDLLTLPYSAIEVPGFQAEREREVIH